MPVEPVSAPAPPVLQRSNGTAQVGVASSAGRTSLQTLFQQGCAKVRLPKTHEHDHLEAVMINTAGGMTGGDRLDWQFIAGKESNLTVTSQACERIYRSAGGAAQIHVSLKVEDASTLFWLPQETIVFDGGSVKRRITADITGRGRLLMVEPLIFGREAMGETVNHGTFKDQWRIRHKGRLVHAEATGFDGSLSRLLGEKAVMDGNIAVATVLLLAPGSDAYLEARLDSVREIIGENGGASLWQSGTTGKLLARIIASNGYEMRKRLIPVIRLLNDNASLPKSWAAQE